MLVAELVGERRYQMDPKGRISLPVKFRESFEDGAFITLGQDGCLYAFPADEWRRRAEEIDRLPISDPKARDYARIFFGKAEQVDLDSQGRLVVPRQLRETARLGKEVVVVGVRDRLEIWGKQAWDEYERHRASSYASGALVPDQL